MKKFGIWTSGIDREALDYLKIIHQAIQNSQIRGRMAYIFLDRAKGEGRWVNKIIAWAKENNLPCHTLSSLNFDLVTKRDNLFLWRERFHQRARRLLGRYQEDFRVLIGYMLILDPKTCQNKPTFNLHPAKPGGPRGKWAEVIWRLIEKKEKEAGITIHLVTPELDAGPPVTYCTFPIVTQGEKDVVFQEIRGRQVLREPFLLIETLKRLTDGSIRVKEGKVVNQSGSLLVGGCSLNQAVEEHFLIG